MARMTSHFITPRAVPCLLASWPQRLMFIGALTGAMLTGCATPPQPPATATTLAIEVTFPLTTAWFEGGLVQYISTDVSDAAMARAKDMNFVPGLAAALKPGQPSLVERIYVFPDGSQRNVLPSMPDPVGYASTDKSYSPLWHLHAVAWQAGRTHRELRSEEQILDAVERGDVTLTPLRIVANCPVVYSAKGGLLPGTRLGYRPPSP